MSWSLEFATGNVGVLHPRRNYAEHFYLAKNLLAATGHDVSTYDPTSSPISERAEELDLKMGIRGDLVVPTRDALTFSLELRSLEDLDDMDPEDKVKVLFAQAFLAGREYLERSMPGSKPTPEQRKQLTRNRWLKREMLSITDASLAQVLLGEDFPAIYGKNKTGRFILDEGYLALLGARNSTLRSRFGLRSTNFGVAADLLPLHALAAVDLHHASTMAVVARSGDVALPGIGKDLGTALWIEHKRSGKLIRNFMFNRVKNGALRPREERLLGIDLGYVEPETPAVRPSRVRSVLDEHREK